MLTLVILSLVVLVSYLVVASLMFGFLPSISASYYKLEKRKKGLGWLFSIALWSTAFPLLIPSLSMTPDGIAFLPFLSLGSMLFIGAAPRFKMREEGLVHYASALVCVVSSQVWAGLMNWKILLPVWLIGLIFMLTVILSNSGSLKQRVVRSCPVMMVEVIAMIPVFILLLLRWI